MPSYPLFEYVEVNQALNPKSHAVAAITGTAIDGTGFDRAMFVLCVGDISTGGGIDAEIKQASTATATYATIAGSGMTKLTAAAGDNKSVIMDVPVAAASPWLKLTGTATTAVVLAGAVCILYNGQATRPPTQGATETVRV